MSVFDILGIDPVEKLLDLLLTGRADRWAKQLWRARRNPGRLAALLAEIIADSEGIYLAPDTPPDQAIGKLVAHAYERHVRAVLARELSREFQRPWRDDELRVALLGIQAMVEGILPRLSR